MTAKPDFKPVQSSNIAAVAHHDGHLFVRFNSGQTWKYPEVPEHLFAGMTAKGVSVGSFFHAHIKSKFAGQKVEAEPVAPNP